MKRILMILCALLAAAVLCAMPFLCTHSNILPEVSTAYYDYKAKEEALTATGPEAELMRMLTGLTADTKLEPVSTPLHFSWYGMVLAIGGAAALAAVYALTRRLPGLKDAILWAGVLAVPFALIGARLTYCAVNLTFYLKDISAPAAMLKIWEGGLSFSGALAGIGLAGVIGAKLGRAPAGLVLHQLVPGMYALVIAACVAVGLVDMGYGPEFPESFLSVNINSTPRLDTSFLVLILIGLMLIISASRLQKTGIPAATRFALYAFLYGAMMILLESLRKDGHMVWGFVHAEMVFDLVFALSALLYLARTKKRIFIALLATAALAGAVVALEFALDRSNLGDGLLYAAYACVISAYLYLGCFFFSKRHPTA